MLPRKPPQQREKPAQRPPVQAPAPEQLPVEQTLPPEIILQRAYREPASLTPADSRRIQQAIGNRAMGRAVGRPKRDPSQELRMTGDGRQPGHRLPSPKADPAPSLQAILRRSAALEAQALNRPARNVRPGSNDAEHGLIQRKPDDIDNKFKLAYDDSGEVLNKGAERAAVSRATKVNYLIRQEWVKPEEPLLGGHLFKREFGGPDDETNVVPWTHEAEEKFTTFEELYSSTAKAAAPVEAEVHTEATFLDRPELETNEGELLGNKWPADDDSGRQKRIQEFEEVAETLADIPKAVKVTVSVPPDKNLSFTAPGAVAIEPPFEKNKAALTSGFKPKERPFDLDPKRPRLFTVVANWRDQKEAARKKLQHEWSHREDFGFASGDKQNTDNLKLFEQRIKAHIEDGTTKQILGTYRGTTTVLHYLDEGTNLWACTKEDGLLVGAWKLGAQQLQGLLAFGKVS